MARDRVRGVLAVLAVTAPFLLGAASAEPRPAGEVVLTFADPAIVESSGLVAMPGRPRRFATVNDSGDRGRVFLVDGAGRTVGVTSWDEDPVDVEALAPAGPDGVWVADIGDNLQVRDHVTVVRVPVGPGQRHDGGVRHDLVHPDGPRDAEALLAHPVTGRLLVVTKGVFGGQVLAAPARLRSDRPNRLTALGQVVGLVTDGAFWPDGRHLVLRTYDTAHVYTYPGLEAVARFDLPDQPQGEGLAVSADGRVFVSTEGQHSELLRVRLPTDARRVLTRAPDDELEGLGWWQRAVHRLLGPDLLPPV